MAVSEKVHVYGVQVGAEFTLDKEYKNVTIIKYPKPFDYESKLKIDFPSTPNYDLKALEVCLDHTQKNNCTKNVLFWNVL